MKLSLDLQHFRSDLSHFVQPLKAPFAAITGGATTAIGLDSVPPGMWLTVGIGAVVLLTLRAVIFFEFRTHERKEQRLYEAIVVTGRSFDTVMGDLRVEVKAMDVQMKLLDDARKRTEEMLSRHEARINTIWESPLVQRVLSQGATQ